MNQVRRTYLILVSAYVQFFEKITSQLSDEAVKSSQFSDIQSTHMESQMGLIEKRLQTIQSKTTEMISRMNTIHTHRLNLIKMKDPFLRAFDTVENWGQITGAVMMLVPTGLSQFLGVISMMLSVISGAMESWRAKVLEDSLNQKMDKNTQEFDDLLDQVNKDFKQEVNSSKTFVPKT